MIDTDEKIKEFLKDLSDFIEADKGNLKHMYTVRIARTKNGSLLVIDSDQDWHTEEDGFEFIDGILGGQREDYWYETDTDWLIGQEDIPKERGIYECKVEFEQWESHHPLDPVEYDCSAVIVEVKKLV